MKKVSLSQEEEEEEEKVWYTKICQRLTGRPFFKWLFSLSLTLSLLLSFNSVTGVKESLGPSLVLVAGQVSAHSAES